MLKKYTSFNKLIVKDFVSIDPSNESVYDWLPTFPTCSLVSTHCVTSATHDGGLMLPVKENKIIIIKSVKMTNNTCTQQPRDCLPALSNRSMVDSGDNMFSVQTLLTSLKKLEVIFWWLSEQYTQLQGNKHGSLLVTYKQMQLEVFTVFTCLTGGRNRPQIQRDVRRVSQQKCGGLWPSCGQKRRLENCSA